MTDKKLKKRIEEVVKEKLPALKDKKVEVKKVVETKALIIAGKKKMPETYDDSDDSDVSEKVPTRGKSVVSKKKAREASESPVVGGKGKKKVREVSESPEVKPKRKTARQSEKKPEKKASKKPNAWMIFLAEFRQDNPGMKGKEVMQEAAKAYKDQ